ncbi:TenA family protein [Nocardioides caldifontis]|uniref:TenA family protein n=1 Tax=Nocardioides caldifontis TaxID=2588938 RepID=UPI0011DFDEB0|nr:TenA family protein [Nocardioides caldifontis]
MIVKTDATTSRLWAAMEPYYQGIVEQPFLCEAREGTLPKETFSRFVVQDGKYLSDYGRCLAMCGARAGNDDDLIMFCEASSRVIHVERTMHAEFLGELGLTTEAAAKVDRSPTLVAYTSWVKQACGMGESHEALASVLPCFWIYCEVGQHLKRLGGSSDPLYQRWIDKYAGDAFIDATQQAVDACGRMARRVGEAGLEVMVETVRMSARYEWMFWDSAYRDEQWPV